MVFALKENSYITSQMMLGYVQVGDELLLRDPDQLGSHSVEDLQQLATAVYQADPAQFEARKGEFKQMLMDRLTSTRKENELVIVPTSSLYIECLVGTHPLVEDFKLIHRALDVKKVQAEVRHGELENIRLAARALRGKDEDPDIEKKIVIEGNSMIALQPDN